MGLGRHDAFNQWILERCREVYYAPDRQLDLWSRGHYKSTIITFAKTIQDILRSHGEDPIPVYNAQQLTFGIFSYNRPMAKQFLVQIMREFENNELLKYIFPDVLYANPRKESPKWSADEGIIVKRSGNPKESTVEAWGLVDGQPTSKHFNVLIYDDTVTIDSVYTPNMMQKTLEAYQMSCNLGDGSGRQRVIGTRYHFNDLYKHMIDSDIVKPRINLCTDDGTIEGTPVLLTREQLDEKRKIMGPFTFATQMLQNPVADETQGFHESWMQYYDAKFMNYDGMNIYILVDPASSKKITSDYTAIFVIGLAADENVYVLDMVRDRLNLTERADIVFRLHRKYRPKALGYERYGMQADIQHIKYRQQEENYRFNIIELAGRMPKNDRIKRLIPLFQAHRVYFPHQLWRSDYQGKPQDLVKTFLQEEYLNFPVPQHDDMLDSLSRMLDEELHLVWPKSIVPTDISGERRRPVSDGWVV